MSDALRCRKVLASIALAALALAINPAAQAQSDFLLHRPEAFPAPLPPTPKTWFEAPELYPEVRISAEPRASLSDPHWLLNATTADSPAGPLPAQERQADYTPITPGGRARWVFKNTFGYRSLTLGIIYSGIQTARNKPEEWGPGWEGFGKRFGTRQATQLIGSSVEASVGALWGEDPRYFHSWRKGFWPRANYAAKMTFFSYRRDGSTGFAYARAIGISAGKAISSTWYPPSNNDWQDTMSRIGISYLGRFLANLWYEFTPEKWHGHK